MKKVNNLNKYLMFIISYIGNTFGNALTIKGAVGAFVWTSAFENVSAFFNISVGTASTLISLTFYIISKIIGKDFKIKDAGICVFLSVLFGALVDFFLKIIGQTPSSSVYINYFLGISGVLIIAISISLAIKANVAFLALDDFLKNLKTYVFKGNVAMATNASQITGFAFAITFGLLHGHILNMTVFTVLATACCGFLISCFDKLFGFNTPQTLSQNIENSI